MEDVALIYWYSCPECESTWGSENFSPAREWCQCESVVMPEAIYEELVDL